MRIVKVISRHDIRTSVGEGRESSRTQFEVGIRGVTRIELLEGCVVVHGSKTDLMLPVIPMAAVVQMFMDATAPDVKR